MRYPSSMFARMIVQSVDKSDSDSASVSKPLRGMFLPDKNLPVDKANDNRLETVTIIIIIAYETFVCRAHYFPGSVFVSLKSRHGYFFPAPLDNIFLLALQRDGRFVGALIVNAEPYVLCELALVS